MRYSQKVDVFNHSFVVKTIVDWNNLDLRVLVAPHTIDCFAKKLGKISELPRVTFVFVPCTGLCTFLYI